MNALVRFGAKTAVAFAIITEGYYHDTHAAVIALGLGLFILATTKETS